MVERFYVNFVNCIHTAPDVGFHIISLYWMDCRVKVFSLLFVGKRLKMNGIFDFFNIFNAREMITNRTERKIFFKNKFCCCHSPLVVSWSLCAFQFSYDDFEWLEWASVHATHVSPFMSPIFIFRHFEVCFDVRTRIRVSTARRPFISHFSLAFVARFCISHRTRLAFSFSFTFNSIKCLSSL